jgi:acyl-CoA thioesterase FadM
MSWIETYRGTVYRWEVDSVDHFTVAYYFARFEDATMGLLEAIGLGREALAGAGRGSAVVECRVRYLKELRVGDILHIRSGVIEADEAGLRLGHEVFNSGDGALCTTVEQRAVLVEVGGRTPMPLSREQREAARTRRVPWDGGAPGVTSSIAVAPAGDRGFLDTARDTVKPWEVDTLGHAAPPAYVHRFSAANAHLLAGFGMTPAYMREQRRGFSTFEFRLRFPGALRAGDLVRVRSALLHVGNSSMRILHRLANARTGEEVATLEQSGVHLDLGARRPTPLPADLRKRAEAVLVTGATDEPPRP